MRFFSAGLTWSGQRARLLFIITLIMVCALVVNITITSSRVHVEATEQIRSTSEVATDLLAKCIGDR